MCSFVAALWSDSVVLTLGQSSLDFAGPFQGKMFLTYSKWPEEVEMSTTAATRKIATLRMLAANGLPEQLVSDDRS